MIRNTEMNSMGREKSIPETTENNTFPVSEHTFSQMATAFQKAIHSAGSDARSAGYVFTGRPVRIRIAGKHLADAILPPFSHLRKEAGAVSRTHLFVDLWSGSETGVLLPEAFKTFHFGEYRTMGASPGSRFLCDQDYRTVLMLDRKHQYLVGYFASSADLSMFDRAKPFHRLLSVWYRDRRIHVIHAAMVSKNGCGILLAGKGGTGKSTTALACMAAGFSYLGDDHIGIRQEVEGSFSGISLYTSALVWNDNAGCLKHTGLTGGEAASGKKREKKMILVSEQFPGQIKREGLIGGIALPRITGAGRTTFRDASKGEALLKLAPSSLMMQAGKNAQGFQQMAELVDAVPCFWLEVGTDLGGISACIENLIIKD